MAASSLTSRSEQYQQQRHLSDCTPLPPPGLHGHQLGFTGLCCSLLVYAALYCLATGFCCPLLPSIGLCCPLQVPSALHYLLLVSAALCCPPLTATSLHWYQLLPTGLCRFPNLMLLGRATLLPVRSSSMWCRVPPSPVSCFLRVLMEGRRETESGSKVVMVLVSLWMVLSERNRGDLGSFSREPSERERCRPSRKRAGSDCFSLLA